MKEVIMPKFGFTQETAQIVQWLVKPGEKVEKGQPIAEVTTDKVNMEVESPANGILADVRYPEGAEVPVTEVICYITAPGEQIPAAPTQAAPPPAEQVAFAKGAAPVEARPAVTPVAARLAREQGIDVDQIAGSGPGGRVTRKDVEAALTQGSPPGKVRAAPAARRLAREMNVLLETVPGSGPHGRIQSSDVRAAATAPQTAAAPAAFPVAPPPQPTPSIPPTGWKFATPLRQTIPVTGMRRTIAERLQKSSQDAPHITFDAYIDMTAALALHTRAAAWVKEDQDRVSLTAVIARAVAWTLERHPGLNAWFLDNAGAHEIHHLAQVNLGVAVALPDGLIVPVIHDASRKGILQLAREINDLSARARSGKLRPDDVTEGTFTLSNLGMFAIDRFTAIINPPEVGILAVSRVRKQIVVDENDQPAVRPLMALTLSVDHRAVDGAAAARFMADLRTALETPDTLAL